MFLEIDSKCFTCNICGKTSTEWFALTAGTPDNYNTMTAGWGGIGVFVGKDVATAYVRPQRYTKEFMDNNELFSMSFLGVENKSAHGIIGKKSGRDGDKVAETELHPVEIGGTVAFEEANLIIVCKKLYVSPMLEEGFLNQEDLERWYPARDIHTMYIGEIVGIYQKQ